MMSDPPGSSDFTINVRKFQEFDMVDRELVGTCRKDHLIAMRPVQFLTGYQQLQRMPIRFGRKLLFNLRSKRKIWRKRDRCYLRKVARHKSLVEEQIVAQSRNVL